jgi:hypothetical protein
MKEGNFRCDFLVSKIWIFSNATCAATSWRAMRGRHPTAATRLAFAYANTPPTAVAAALLRTWAGPPLTPGCQIGGYMGHTGCVCV